PTRSESLKTPTRPTNHASAPVGTINQIWCRLALAAPRSPSVSASDDPLEREADRAADTVLSSSRLAMRTSHLDGPLRKCACGEGSQKPCESCRESEERVDRKARQNGPTNIQAREIELHGGAPLDPTIREWFEQRFGYDFEAVRVHTDARASETTRSFGAPAMAVGGEIT